MGVAAHFSQVALLRGLSVTLDVRTPLVDVEARRQAVAQSEQISDMAFALAVGSKWGDYDPGGAKE